MRDFSPIKFDFHLHTLDDPRDRHVRHTVFELIDRASSLGYGALSVTLHAEQFQSREAEDYAKRRNLMLIPGVEQDIEGCHVLLINFDRDVAHGVKTFAQLAAARALSPDGLVIAAHPFYPNETCLKEKIFVHHALFDAVEMSGFYHQLWNPNHKAVAAAQKLGLPLVGNSDTHTLEQFGTIWSEVRCDRHPAEMMRAIKAGKANVKSRPLGTDEFAVIAWKVIAMGYMPWIDYKKIAGMETFALSLKRGKAARSAAQ